MPRPNGEQYHWESTLSHETKLTDADVDSLLVTYTVADSLFSRHCESARAAGETTLRGIHYDIALEYEREMDAIKKRIKLAING